MYQILPRFTHCLSRASFADPVAFTHAFCFSVMFAKMRLLLGACVVAVALAWSSPGAHFSNSLTRYQSSPQLGFGRGRAVSFGRLRRPLVVAMAASADDDEGAAKNAADANAAASSSKKSRKVSPASSPPPRRRLALAKLQRLAPVVFARSLVLRLKLLAVRVRMRKNRRGSALWLLVAAVACSKAVARAARAPAVAVREVPWSLFLQSLDAAPAACRVSDVLVGPQRWDFLLDGADRCYAARLFSALFF